MKKKTLIVVALAGALGFVLLKLVPTKTRDPGALIAESPAPSAAQPADPSPLRPKAAPPPEQFGANLTRPASPQVTNENSTNALEQFLKGAPTEVRESVLKYGVPPEPLSPTSPYTVVYFHRPGETRTNRVYAADAKTNEDGTIAGFMIQFMRGGRVTQFPNDGSVVIGQRVVPPLPVSAEGGAK